MIGPGKNVGGIDCHLRYSLADPRPYARLRRSVSRIEDLK